MKALYDNRDYIAHRCSYYALKGSENAFNNALSFINQNVLTPNGMSLSYGNVSSRNDGYTTLELQDSYQRRINFTLKDSFKMELETDYQINTIMSGDDATFTLDPGKWFFVWIPGEQTEVICNEGVCTPSSIDIP